MWLLAMMFALLSLAGVAFTVTVIGAVRQRAAGAADLAALAAAGTPPADEHAVCALAARVSAANGGQLVGCQVVDDAVEVAVRVRLPTVIGVRGEVIGHARAGPWGRAGGAYQPQPVQAAGPERTSAGRTSAGRASARSSASPPSPRRRRSATLATIRSPRRGWEAARGEAAESASLASDRGGVGTRTADRPPSAEFPVRVSLGLVGRLPGSRTFATLTPERSLWSLAGVIRRSRAVAVTGRLSAAAASSGSVTAAGGGDPAGFDVLGTSAADAPADVVARAAAPRGTAAGATALATGAVEVGAESVGAVRATVVGAVGVGAGAGAGRVTAASSRSRCRWIFRRWWSRATPYPSR
ncbi:exported hypothetical protein [Frankia sp. AgKG'84/4]